MGEEVWNWENGIDYAHYCKQIGSSSSYAVRTLLCWYLLYDSGWQDPEGGDTTIPIFYRE